MGTPNSSNSGVVCLTVIRNCGLNELNNPCCTKENSFGNQQISIVGDFDPGTRIGLADLAALAP